MLVLKLTELKERLIKDSTIVEDMLAKSMQGLMEGNEVMLLEVVNTQEPQVNEYDRAIDELCVEVVAQYEPVARDLRTVIMIVKMNKDLERIGDHAVNVCESALFLIAQPNVGDLKDLKLMADNAARMLKDSIHAFAHNDINLAQLVLAKDTIVDQAGDNILSQMTKHMNAHKEAITQSLHIMRIAHNLERVADLATNIAEEVIYMVEGRDVKHKTHE